MWNDSVYIKKRTELFNFWALVDINAKANGEYHDDI